MAQQVVIGGAKEFREVARRLERADLGRAALRGIERGAEPGIRAAKAEPEKRLPKRGGLAARVARTRIETKVRSRGLNPGVRIVAQPNAVRDPRAIDRGRVRHQVFGRPVFVLQRVRAGWFYDPMTKNAPAVRASIERELSAEIERI